ncbi:MAG: B12-binding domain-containing radical SAM protein [Promethearchaeota archaeon]
MKIALIYPGFSENIEIFKKRFARFYFREANVMPPLGLGYIASVLEHEGHNVLIIDNNVLKLPWFKIVKKLKKFKPQLVGFSILTHVFPYTVKMIKYIKKKINSIDILVGGLHIGLYPDHILKIQEIDYAIVGEGEITIKEFIQIYEKYKNGEIENIDEEFRKVKGLIFRDKNNKIIINPPRELISDLDNIPFPARHLFPLNKYKTFFMDKNKKATSIITARGCPFQCNYCAEKFSKYRLRSVNNVLNELEEIYFKYNIRDIYFNDGTFTVNKKRTIAICKGIMERGLKITFNIRTRVDCVDEEIIKYLAAAGCNRINFGFESGDEKILKNLNKNTKISQMVKAVSLAKKYGIKIFGFFMIGCPGETKETIKKTISTAISLDPDFVQFSRLNPFSGSQLYFDFVKKTGKDIWLEYSLGRTNCKDIIFPDSNFTKTQLEKFVLKAYRKFYIRPKYIIKKIKEIDSINKAIKYVKAAISVI